MVSFGIVRWMNWDGGKNATEYAYVHYSTMQQKILREFGAATTKQLLPYPMISVQTHTLHVRGWQSRYPKFSPLMYSHTVFVYKYCMSLPFVPLWRTSAHFNKTLFSLSSTSQILVPHRCDGSTGSSQQEASNHVDLFLSVVGVDLHVSTSWLSFCLQTISAFCFFQHWIFFLGSDSRMPLLCVFLCFCGTESSFFSFLSLTSLSLLFFLLLIGIL